MMLYLHLLVLISFTVTPALQCSHVTVAYAECSLQGLKTIPEHLPYSIRHLILSKNNISRITIPMLQKYPNIIHLNLDYNEIRTYNGLYGIWALRKLQIISISGNNMVFLSFNAFRRNLDLTEINANDNPGININETPVTLKKLQKISLNSNKLGSFPYKALSGFSSLKLLELKNNNITYLPEGIHNRFPNLMYLSLSGNPIANSDYKSEVVIVRGLATNTLDNNHAEDRTANQSKVLADNSSSKQTEISKSAQNLSNVYFLENVRNSKTHSSNSFSDLGSKKVSYENSYNSSVYNILMYGIYMFAFVDVVLIIIALGLYYINSRIEL